jgi:hypothetical protein
MNELLPLSGNSSRAKTEARSHERGTVPAGNVSGGRNRRIVRRREPAESRLQPGLAAPQEAWHRGRPVRHNLFVRTRLGVHA